MEKISVRHVDREVLGYSETKSGQGQNNQRRKMGIRQYQVGKGVRSFYP
jgi:hypothetical protein